MRTDQSAEGLRSWRESFNAALFETDASKLPLRIEEARRALVSRSRELLATSPNHDGGVEGIEDALYALHALENSMKLDTKDRRRAPRAS
jgi:hypothetical protein